MATAETVKAQLQADIAAANAVTGKQDATMHDAVASLIEGFGGGGGGGGGVGKLICDTVIDVPESDTALDITIDNVVTENATGDIYVTILEFLGEIPTDTTIFTAYATATMNYGHGNPFYADSVGGLAYGVNAGNKTTNRYAPNNTIYVGAISNTGTITVKVKPTITNYATCRGQWRMRCYKVLTM